MIDPERKTAAMCLATNIMALATHSRTNAEFDDGLWHALETFRLDIAALKRRDTTFTVIDGGAA